MDGSVGQPVSELDLEREERFRPPAGSGPLWDSVLDREVDQLAGGVFAGEAAFGLDRFAQLAVERLDGVGIRYERRQMSSLPPTGRLQLLSASGSVSTVRPSGSRGIRERTQAGQAGLIRCAVSAG